MLLGRYQVTLSTLQALCRLFTVTETGWHIILSTGSTTGSFECRGSRSSSCTCNRILIKLTAAHVALLQPPSHLLHAGLWEAQRFKSSCNEGPCLQTMHLLLNQTMLENLDPAALKKMQAAASSESNGVHVAKGMTEAPANICTPTHMAEVAGALAQLAPGGTCCLQPHLCIAAHMLDACK